MVFPGPPPLGRGCVTAAGAPVPAHLARAPALAVDAAVLDSPAATVAMLAEAWAERRAVAVSLAVDAADLGRTETTTRAPWTLAPEFEFARERLNFLVWANNWDMRSGEPIWWKARKAARLGAAEGGPADVLLPGGEPAWVDGGPRAPVDVPEALLHRESLEEGSLLPDARATPPTHGLAPDQHAAVAHTGGPARVIAPAGSGKTRVLAERLRHLLADRGVAPGIVTAVAYNRKAAEELRERTAALAPHVRTIHSLGLAICQSSRPCTVLDEREVRRILDGLVDVRHRANQDVLAPYVEALGEVRVALRDPAAVEAERDDVPGFADVFGRYRRLLADRDLVDFDEQIFTAIELLLRDGELRARAQRRCRHLLVDEFQDLTPAHLLLLRLLAAPAYQVFGVGDDDQVIYGHAGADPRFLVEFTRLFPGAHTHALEVNYRCPPAVVAAAAGLLGHNLRRVPKTIRAAPGRGSDGGSLTVVRAPADALAARAAEWMAAAIGTGTAPSDTAVLARVNAALLPVQAALHGSGIPFQSTLGVDVLGRTGMRTALAYLRIGLAPDRIERSDVLDTIRRPSRRIRRELVDRIGRRRVWSVDALESLAVPTGRDAERLAGYVADLRLVTAAAQAGPSARVLQTIRSEVGLGNVLAVLDASRSGADRSTHVDDLDALEAAAALHTDPATFVSWLAEVLTGSGAGRDAVHLSSVHRVKGREWSHVVVYGAHEGLLPHHLARTTAQEEEERRVFHVALTRCRDRVLVLADQARPAPFLDEMEGRAPRRTRRRPLPSDAAGARRPGTPAPVPDAEALTPADLAVFDTLRAWRAEQARADGVPAYVVCHDRSLRAIASQRPATLAALSLCPGIGPTKLERYGDEILGIVENATA